MSQKEEILTPEGQMALFWRILHLLTARYGNHPMGQLLVALTMVFMNERGTPPTMTEICAATGLPKSSVSRYVSWQIEQGLAREEVDPNDRRRRRLVQTPKVKAEWRWQVKQIGQLFDEISELDNSFRLSSDRPGAEDLLERLIEINRQATGNFS
jgi:DNA-binding MarR family transcriptional regulator